MQINITRKNAGLSDSLRAYVENKLGGLGERFSNVIDANVLFSEHGKDSCVEISLHVTGVNMFAKDQSTNLRASFDSCVDKLERQLSKRKEKLRRKTLTKQEAVLSGKVFVGNDSEPENVDGPEQPVLLFEPEEENDDPEQRTGT